MNEEFLIDFEADPELPAPHSPGCRQGTLSAYAETNDGCLPVKEGGGGLPTPPPSISLNKWDPRLLLDLVIAVDSLDTILERYDLSREEYNILSSNVVFRRELASTMRDIRENGASFRAKARIQAEAYLPVVDDMIWDTDIAASTRLDAVKSVVRWGDLEPKNKQEQVQQAAPQINVQILF